jgi:hypothetical protein
MEVAISPAPTAPQPGQPPRAEHHVSFHDVLSVLNPLQYLPVLGTIYRAMTGDQIPDPVRRIGSVIVSAVIGGPVGAAINVATQAAEKITGIDLDHTGQSLLKSSGVTGLVASPRPAPVPPARPDPPVPPVPQPVVAWSPAQLATYGITTTGDGTLKRADLMGADVLNALELSRIRSARSAYEQAVRLAA